VVGYNAALCVHPMFVHKGEDGEAPFAFFNDLSKDKVGLLNYPLSKHYRDKELFNEFHQFIPLDEWRLKSGKEFNQRIEIL